MLGFFIIETPSQSDSSTPDPQPECIRGAVVSRYQEFHAAQAGVQFVEVWRIYPGQSGLEGAQHPGLRGRILSHTVRYQQALKVLDDLPVTVVP
ncbi:MAG: hypothetical protein L0177_19280, partial [Chloroflexi bacterium]|nr:hypothetical protein [Chloroflexota bacterium]